jgi:uncharacterized membrane-anchored protein YjiN (DUF445 family)
MPYKQTANLILALVFMLFVSAAIWKYFQPQLFGVRFYYFVCEAALIGGLADWFAVTALFRKPLNWPYHTALIPRNREKVIDAVVNMVQQDLLNPEVIRIRLKKVDFFNYLGAWLEKEEHLPYLIDITNQAVTNWFISLPPEKAADYLAPFVKRKFLLLQPAPLIKDFVLHVLTSGQVDSWLDKVFLKTEELARRKTTRDFIYDFLQKQKDEKISQGLLNSFVITMLEATGGLNLHEAAECFQAQLSAAIISLQDRQHPLRHSIKEKLRHAVSGLDQDALVQAVLETWPEENSSVIPFTDLSTDIIRHLQEKSTRQESSLINLFIKEMLEAIWLSCHDNSLCAAHINDILHKALSDILEEKQAVIGEIAREALYRLTDEDLVRFVEDKAGNDLQWIRINGSIIGGLVGIILFLFLALLYDPYVVPYLNKWLL